MVERLHQGEELLGPLEATVSERAESEAAYLADEFPQTEEIRLRGDSELGGTRGGLVTDDGVEEEGLHALLEGVLGERSVLAELSTELGRELTERASDLGEFRRLLGALVQPPHRALGEAAEPSSPVVNLVPPDLPLPQPLLDLPEDRLREPGAGPVTGRV
jgi:hypothetical protein